MKILTPGHKYELENFESNSPGPLSQHAHESRLLCYAIECLPASEEQTKLSLAASALQRLLYSGCQTLQFIEKRPIEEGSTTLETVHNGTTNEELLRVLIDRMQFLQSKFPCKANAIVITNLEESLMWLEQRTRDRLARGVEGSNQK